MATEFKAFAIGLSNEVTDQATYNASTWLTKGWTSGILPHVQINKVLRQATTPVAAFTQVVSEIVAADITDDGDLTGLTAKVRTTLSAALPYNPAGVYSPGSIGKAIQDLGTGAAWFNADTIKAELAGQLDETQFTAPLITRLNQLDDPTFGVVVKVADLEATYGGTAAAAVSAADAAQAAIDAVGAANTASIKAGEAFNSATSASSSAITATSGAATATTKADEATSAASSATGSASTATTQAGIATTSANNAGISASTAVTKAGEASTSASDAGTYATAAYDTLVLAQAALGDASVAASNAASSADDASGSASLASSKADLAAASESAAFGSASAASGSASLASTKAGEAGTSATAANVSKLAAEVAKGDAESAATASFNSQVLAGEQAALAIEASGLAITARLEASGFASAASGHSSTASGFATTAGTHATAAYNSSLAAEASSDTAGTHATASFDSSQYADARANAADDAATAAAGWYDSTVAATGSLTAAVEAQADVVSGPGGLTAQYVLKVQTTRIDGKKVFGAIGLASTAPGDATGGQSEILLQADRLVFIPSSDPNAPLTNLLELGLVNGVNTLRVPAALIGDLTVSSLKIGDNAVTVASSGQAISASTLSATEATILDLGTMNTTVNGVAKPLYMHVELDGEVQAAASGGGLTNVVYRVKVGGVTVRSYTFSATVPSQTRAHVKSGPLYVAEPPVGDFSVLVTSQLTGNVAGPAEAGTTVTLFALGTKK